MDEIDFYKAAEQQIYHELGVPNDEEDPTHDGKATRAHFADVPLLLALSEIAEAAKIG